MKFSNILTYSIFAPIIIGSLIMLLVTLIPINKEEDTWKNMLNNYVSESQLNSKLIKLEFQGNYINTFFRQTNNHINLIKNNIELHINGNISINNYYDTYFAVSTIDSRIPPIDYNSDSFFTGTFIRNVFNQNDLNNIDQYILKNTSIYDDIFRAVYKSSENYVSVYFGFEKNGFFRRYPYVPLNSYQNFAYKCYYNNLNMIGYDPRCRIWYSIAEEDTKYTSPYVDALTNNVMITASIKVMNSTEMYGVVGIDFVMNSINDIILKSSTNSEYNFLMDSNYNLISHPNLKYDKVYNAQILEPILNNVNLMDINKKYLKIDNKYIFVNYLEELDYYLISIYSEDNIIKTTNSIFNDVSKVIKDGTISISIIICTMIVFNVFFIRYFSKRYSKPINSFTKDMKSIKDVNLDIELGNKAPISSEFTNVNNKLRTLMTAVKFGNDLYYNGDLNKALDSYNSAESLMKTLNIKRGLSICYNNKANVLKQLNNTNEAEKLYLESIRIAEEFIQSEKDQLKLTAWYVALSNRMMNLGVLYKDIFKLNEAEKYLNKSLDYANKSDNSIGKTKIVNNISQLYLQTGRINEAEKIIHETYQQILGSNSDKFSIQYAELNYALLELYKKNYILAKNYFENILYKYQEIDSNLKNVCIHNLYTIAQNTNNKDDMNKLQSHLSANNSTKNVSFLLDISGSMDGNPINQCKNSILNIINTYLRDNDNISMFTFNENVNYLFTNMSKTLNYDFMKNSINQIKANGGTAFYTGLEKAINCSYVNSWIIALTDGEDNRSEKNSYNNIFNQLKKKNVNIVVITIGRLDARKDIEKILHSVGNNNIGKLIEINNSNEEINKVFQNVAKLITGQLNVESL